MNDEKTPGNCIFQAGADSTDGTAKGGAIVFQKSDGTEIFRVDDQGVHLADGSEVLDCGALCDALWAWLRGAKVEESGKNLLDLPRGERRM